jgi:hypothetical protein
MVIKLSEFQARTPSSSVLRIENESHHVLFCLLTGHNTQIHKGILFYVQINFRVRTLFNNNDVALGLISTYCNLAGRITQR